VLVNVLVLLANISLTKVLASNTNTFVNRSVKVELGVHWGWPCLWWQYSTAALYWGTICLTCSLVKLCC
jgi:hypothetical protein